MKGTENNSWLRDRKVPQQGFGRWKADQSDVMRSTGSNRTAYLTMRGHYKFGSTCIVSRFDQLGGLLVAKSL